jgi:glutamate dehydrogenase/leucine dehydrogenase
LAREGARVVGILDASSAVASPEGLDEGDVSDLLRRRKGRELPEHPQRVQGPEREAAYRSEADLFIPAAISGSVDSRRLGQLARHGVRRMVCGANQPFQEVRLGETVTAQAADQSFDVVPEIIASLGTAHTFYHLMTKTGVHSADEIFEAVGRSVDGGVDAVMERVGSTAGGLMATAVEIALERTA